MFRGPGKSEPKGARKSIPFQSYTNSGCGTLLSLGVWSENQAGTQHVFLTRNKVAEARRASFEVAHFWDVGRSKNFIKTFVRRQRPDTIKT